MKISLWLKIVFFSTIIFTSLVLPLAFLETSVSNYGNIALSWAGSNKLSISLLVILALTADVILPVPNGLTNTLAGMSLGWALSSIVIWIGLTLGATLAYILGRFAGRPILKKIISNNDFEEAEASLKNFNIIGLIISRPVPGFAELIAISAGISKIPYKIFFIVIGITNIGVAITFAAIGAAAIQNESASLVFFGIAILPAALYFLYIKLNKN